MPQVPDQLTTELLNSLIQQIPESSGSTAHVMLDGWSITAYKPRRRQGDGHLVDNAYAFEIYSPEAQA